MATKKELLIRGFRKKFEESGMPTSAKVHLAEDCGIIDGIITKRGSGRPMVNPKYVQQIEGKLADLTIHLEEIIDDYKKKESRR